MIEQKTVNKAVDVTAAIVTAAMNNYTLPLDEDGGEAVASFFNKVYQGVEKTLAEAYSIDHLSANPK